MFDLKKALNSIDEETREKCKKLVQKYILTHKDEYAAKAVEVLNDYAEENPAIAELLDFLKEKLAK